MIQLICFSRNRPLQLHGYLTSVFNLFSRHDLFSVDVLFRADSIFQPSYEALTEEFPQVTFTTENDFSKDLLNLIGDSAYTCFGCDDVVFIRPVDIDLIMTEFREDLFGFSLRLGLNLNKSMFAGAMAAPPMLPSAKQLLLWDLHSSHAFIDWGYSWELTGTVYPTTIVRQVIEELRPQSPNLLEAGGGGRWSNKTNRHLMSAWSSSRLVIPTINVVQDNFPNPVCGKHPISTEFLLTCWRNGLRMDIDAFALREYDCIHIPNFYLYRK